MNNLIIRNKKKTELTADTWKDGFIAVDKERHWEPGRSAERLANDFSNGFPSSGENSLRSIIKLFLHTDDIQWDKAFIEHGSRFDQFRRPRMQDLAIWGKAAGKSFFIGVEAKVDEPFGSRCIKEQEEYINGLKGKTNTGKRLNALKEDFLSGIDKSKYGEFRYQLLYYLAGSFREDADVIIMPVFTYKSDKYNSDKGQANFDAYDAFMRGLGFIEVTGKVDNMRVAYFKVITAYDKKHEQPLTKRVYSCYFEK